MLNWEKFYAIPNWGRWWSLFPGKRSALLLLWRNWTLFCCVSVKKNSSNKVGKLFPFYHQKNNRWQVIERGRETGRKQPLLPHLASVLTTRDFRTYDANLKQTIPHASPSKGGGGEKKLCIEENLRHQLSSIRQWKKPPPPARCLPPKVIIILYPLLEQNQYSHPQTSPPTPISSQVKVLHPLQLFPLPVSNQETVELHFRKYRRWTSILKQTANRNIPGKMSAMWTWT